MPEPRVDAIIWEQAGELYERHQSLDGREIVSFYPPFMEAERHRFALAFTTLDGTVYCFGDQDYRFPLYSISKVFTYGMALEDNGRSETLRWVGVEPSGDPYNSFTFDQRQNRPFNPMVNSGALVAANLVHGKDRDEKVGRVLERLRVYAANPGLRVNEEILAIEFDELNDRNRGLGFLMRSLGMLVGDVDAIIGTYLSLCAVEVTVKDLATMAATLANGGANPLSGERALPAQFARDVLTVMSTCGMYDAAGEWAYDVGVPAKSGVAGAIMLSMPQNFGGAVFSPGLDVHGNSVRGVNVCRDLSDRFGLHEYTDPQAERLGLTPSEWARVGNQESPTR